MEDPHFRLPELGYCTTVRYSSFPNKAPFGFFIVQMVFAPWQCGQGGILRCSTLQIYLALLSYSSYERFIILGFIATQPLSSQVFLELWQGGSYCQETFSTFFSAFSFFCLCFTGFYKE